MTAKRENTLLDGLDLVLKAEGDLIGGQVQSTEDERPQLGINGCGRQFGLCTVVEKHPLQNGSLVG